jgi:uncharacterized membrane protein
MSNRLQVTPRETNGKARAVVAATTIGVGAVAYFYFMHAFSDGADAATRTLALTIVAWLGFFAVFAWAARKWVAMALLITPIPLVYVFYDALRFMPWLNLVPNTLIYASLTWVFGRTLISGRTALITQLATRIHGTLPAPIERYTRQTTWVWACYFLLTIVVSWMLYFGVSFEAWSVFSNLLSLPILILLFVGEYVYRRLAFPWFEHVSIAAGVKAFTAHQARANDAEGNTQ